MANYQSSNYGIFIEIYYPHLAIIKLSNRKSISIHVRARHWRVPWSVHQHWPPQPSTLQWRPSMLWRRYPSWSYEWMSVPEEAVFTTHLKPKDITVVGIFKHIWLYRLYHMITLYIYIFHTMRIWCQYVTFGHWAGPSPPAQKTWLASRPSVVKIEYPKPLEFRGRLEQRKMILAKKQHTIKTRITRKNKRTRKETREHNKDNQNLDFPHVFLLFLFCDILAVGFLVCLFFCFLCFLFVFI